jgi:glycosyltransferase involved in cell wall biosynthesis
MPHQEVHGTPYAQLRVLHVASGDLWAGAEAQVFELVTNLRKMAVQCAVVLLNEGELANRLRNAGIFVVVVSERTNSVWRIMRKIEETIRSFRPQVIHTHRFKENLVGSIAGRLHGVPSTRTIHGAPEAAAASAKSKVLASLDVWVGRNLQRCVVAVSHDLSGKMQPIFGTHRVKVIHNGVDPERVRELAPETVSASAPHSARIGFVGRLTQVKRVDVFLRIAALLRDRLEINLETLIIGDGPLRPELERLARELGIRCEFTGFQSNCLPSIAALDALLLTSDHEGMPIVALEALALGTPIVCHAVGGLPELIQSEAQGYLVPSQRPEDYLPPLEKILGRARSGAPRPNLLPADFWIQRTAAKYAELYRSISATIRDY